MMEIRYSSGSLAEKSFDVMILLSSNAPSKHLEII